jgi:hypothetical protein
MSDDDITALLGGLALFICFPTGLLATMHGHWSVGAFAMAAAAYLQGLSNHE